MKQSTLIFLFAIQLFCFSVQASAHDIEVKNDDGVTIYYVFNSAKTELMVSFRGSSSSEYFNEYRGNVVIPSSATYNEKPYPVTSIGEDAFYYCYGLNSVTIPESIKSIGNNSFAGCFYLTSIAIPESVTSIGFGAFQNCFNLTSVAIPEGVTSIGMAAFFRCYGLTSIKVADSNTRYDSRNDCNAIIETASNKLIVGCRNTIIPEGVTNIGDDAFWGCSGLTSINIPESVIIIDSNSFRDCSGLTSITVADGNSVYDSRNECNAIIETASNTLVVGCRNTIIPSGVTGIGSCAFSSCNGLTSITIPEDVTHIDNYAFPDCSGLISITVANGNSVYDSRNECNAIIETASNKLIVGCQNTIIPNGVTSIGDYAFYGRSNLTSFTIPEGVTSIGYRSFQYCRSLTSITLPESVFSIGSQAFEDTEWYDSQPDGLIYVGKVAYGYKGIMPNNTSIVIKDGTKGIGGSAFYDCSGLTSVTIPKGVTSIDNDAFRGCSGLTSITIPEGVTSIGEGTFSGCSGLTSITIPESVTCLGEWAFSDCCALTSITILEGVTSIGDYAFFNCSGLTSITIPEGVISIGEWAFNDCSGLTSVIIPEGVTSIGDGAFWGCTGLEIIYCYATRLPSTGKNAFVSAGYYKKGTTLYVPTSALEAYKSSGPWSGFDRYVGFIPFADSFVKFLCVTKWDTDGDGELSGTEASAVTDIGSTFKSQSTMKSFDEFHYFTGLTSIGSSAFFGCNNLTSITIPESVRSICNGAFKGCSNLTSVTIPEKVISIGNYAFSYCNGLTSFSVANGNTVYDSRNDCNAIIKTISNELIAGCQNSQIPESVISIGNSAFLGCSSLTSITIPESVNSISDYAFYGCSGLTSVVINGPSSVGEGAFKNCSNIVELIIGCKDIYANAFSGLEHLKKIELSANVASIGSKAFANCPHLEDVYCYAVRYPIASDDAFYGSYADYVTLYVPAESVENYRKNSPWNSFKEILPIGEMKTNYEVSISRAGYATFYDSQTDYALPEGLTAYVVTSVENDKLTYERVKAGNQSGIVPKGVAVVLKSDQKQAGVYTLTRTNSNVQYTGDNLLHGNDETTFTTADENCCYYKLAYGAAGTDLSDVFGWYWGAANGSAFTIEGHKAWLAIPKEQANHVKSFSIEGEATAIADVEDEMQSADNAVYYDLQGRRISRPTRRGIYIRNGKKVALSK